MRYVYAEAMEKDRMDLEEFDALRRAADAERAEERKLRHFMAETLLQEGLGELKLRFPNSR